MTKAVILCAGIGIRLRPLTDDLPKVMLPIQGRPLLEHHIEHFRKYGVKEFYLNLHHLPERIQEHFGNGSRFGVRIIYAYEKELTGTAGALNHFRDELTETFAVHYGDILSKVNVEKMLRFHLKNGAAGTLVVQPTPRPHDSDVLEIGGDGRIFALHHIPGGFQYGNLGNAASYIAEPRVLAYIPQGQPSDFVQDVFPRMLAQKVPLFAYQTDEYMEDIGTPERYERAQKNFPG